MSAGADQFTPLPHRQGYGALTFQGREFTQLEWIERIARRGGTLAAGEGKLLVAELDRLRALRTPAPTSRQLDTGTGPARRRLTLEEAQRGDRPTPTTPEEWAAMWHGGAR
jgi:hypothetical protein